VAQGIVSDNRRATYCSVLSLVTPNTKALSDLAKNVQLLKVYDCNNKLNGFGKNHACLWESAGCKPSGREM
jgi:hypothetical protein